MQDAVIRNQGDVIFHASECAAGIGHQAVVLFIHGIDTTAVRGISVIHRLHRRRRHKLLRQRAIVKTDFKFGGRAVAQHLVTGHTGDAIQCTTQRTGGVTGLGKFRAQLQVQANAARLVINDTNGKKEIGRMVKQKGFNAIWQLTHNYNSYQVAQ